MKNNSMWEGLENLREIPESRFNDRVFEMHDSRFPLAYLLKGLSEEYAILRESDEQIFLLTKEKVDWITDLQVEVEDHRPLIVFKSFKDLRNRTKKVWEEYIGVVTKDAEETLNRLDEWAQKNNFC